ncbi:MAG TPA: response regulator transcription factor [Nitrospira sp.]|nr:response regulator transcription factor [Nitrospira sp.]
MSETHVSATPAPRIDGRVIHSQSPEAKVPFLSFRVLLADDHILLRQGVRALIEGYGLNVVGEAGDGREAIRLAEETQPDFAVLDVMMPLLNGLDVVREIKRVSPRTKSLLLTMHTDDIFVLEALRAGVKGYLLKTQPVADVVRAIRDVSNGSFYLSPGISQTVIHAYLAKTDLPPDPLTTREREVLQLVAQGMTTKKVAGLLGVSVKTAESHRHRIMDKLDLHDTASLVRYSIRRRLIEP